MPERKKPMPDLSHGMAELSPIKRALHEIRELRARLAELESARHEPVAIIGAGFCLPGDVNDEQSFWNLLASGRDAITEIPRERWDWRAYFDADADAPGSMYTQHGGFLKGFDLFDASFFGISPREAVAMDPQHRIALEVGWEALENAGYSPGSLRGSATGVFLGIANQDYGRAALTDLDSIDAYTGSGNSSGMVAGRLSYVLGLHGPSLAIDTSCSSSLVAVHLACASLRAGECRFALAGGVNLILSPESNIALSKAHMMARDGRCKTFDEAADGYVRSEGCSIAVLKKLSDAISDGDRILAVIRGSAVNHDGRSGGLTAPNGPAQAAVMRSALAAAGVNASEIGYVEAHGTGTSLGDPIEVETLASVMGSGRSSEHPLYIGSVKTNIGHAEAASGIAGLMKAVLALGHQEIPPNLHFDRRNPHIDWDRLAVSVPTGVAAWLPRNGHRYAGVSSFGFSGTNAHAILEEAPKREIAANSGERRQHILTVSARTETALQHLCAKYVEALRAAPANGLPDLCFTANAGRTHLAYRIAVTGETAEQIAQELERFGKADPTARVFAGNAEGVESRRIGFLFTGQGSQYGGMGRELYASAPVFREAVERCAALWKEETGESLIEVLYPLEGEASRMGEARYAQPALFAFEYGLAELWRSWGVEPGVLLGHSLGEYVAAVVGGVFSVEDGLGLVCARARLMDGLTEAGAMWSISASAERVRAEIQVLEEEDSVSIAAVSIAAINGPESVVLSGALEAVERIAGKLQAEGIRTRRLEVTHAFHSPLLEPMLEEFEACARQVTYHAPCIRIISNVTGKAAGEEIATPQYWRRHMRQAVLFHAGLQTAIDTGCDAFIEIGPQPHLKAIAVRTDESLEKRILASLRRPRADWDQMLESLAALYIQGQDLDWKGFDEGHHRVRVALPTYPFERQRYWLAGGDIDFSQRIWQRCSAAALAQSKLAPIGLKVETFAAKWECLKRLTIAEILRTLQEFGAFAQPGVFHDADSLIAECGILPAHRKLIGRWLNMLSEAGYLEQNGSRFVNRAPLPDADTDSVWRETEIALSDDPFLLEYLYNCSKHLSGVLAGRTSPLETLFPGGSPDLARNLYENSGGARYANLIVAAAVQAACAALPANRRLRVIELGGGTGATTAAILPLLPPERVSYYFTDVSESFLHRAADRFPDYPFVRYGVVNIENEEHMAGHSGSFDLVIAANVVHATRDLNKILAGVASLLNPAGVAVLLETTQDLTWHNITTGLIEGWQKSADDLRADTPLLGAEEWISALRQAGFKQVISVPETESPAGDIGLHVILAGGVVSQAGVPETQRPTYAAAENKWLRTVDAGLAVPDLQILLKEAPSAERHAILLKAVCEEIARVMRLATDTAPKRQDRLMDLGMDSLMAVELRNRLAQRLQLDSLPATLIFDYPTPDAIAEYLLQRMQNQNLACVEDTSPQVSVRRDTLLTADEVADLSEEEVAALLWSQLTR